MKLIGNRKSTSFTAAVLTLAVSLGALFAPVTRAAADPPGSLDLLLLPIPVTQHYWYWDAQGWGTLDATIVGQNNQTGEKIIRVRVAQNWFVFDGSGSESAAGNLTFVLPDLSLFFEGKAWAWGTYHTVGAPQFTTAFWLQPR